MYINRNCYYTMKQTLTSSSQLPLDHLSELNGSRLNAAFDYLENVPNIAATVCDKEGIVLYQNKRAIDRDGNVAGLIELAIDLPEEMPVFNRDKE